MRRAGTVERVAQGLLVLRADDSTHASIGDAVIDERLAEIGRVVDVFGPVERPYLAVTPEEDVHGPALVGETLYQR